MRVLFINAVCGTGSTGRICAELAQQYEKENWECRIAYGRDGYVPEKFRKYAVRIGGNWDVRLHGIRTRLLDDHGFGSKAATKKFLQWAEQYQPDLLWLHNLHGYYINIELLFEWIKSRPEMEVRWTLHDCWAFTGHCTYFLMENCDKWKMQCENCRQKTKYPASKWRDNSWGNYNRKREVFTGVSNMTLVTPSKWLAELVNQSFLREYPIEIRYNTIDTNIFKPTPSDFRKNYGLEDKKIILGVSNTWEERKGLNDFIKLSKMLNEDYVIILIGLNEKQCKSMPKKIIGIKRTNNQRELAEIYTAADIFVNPTYEDNYPTVNLEAQACGTYVLTYDTGGSKETIYGNGKVISADIKNLYTEIVAIFA